MAVKKKTIKEDKPEILEIQEEIIELKEDIVEPKDKPSKKVAEKKVEILEIDVDDILMSEDGTTPASTETIAAIEAELTQMALVASMAHPYKKLVTAFDAKVKVPNGLPAIIATYGMPMYKGKLNKKWYADNVKTIVLPYTMRLAWDTSKTVKTISFHKTAAPALIDALTNAGNYARIQVKKKYPDRDTAFYDKMQAEYLKAAGVDLFGGSFAFRVQRGSSKKLSTHSWAIAIDIDPANNKLGDHSGAIPMWFVNIMKAAGFIWGGDWNRPDPMHFQLCSGY